MCGKLTYYGAIRLFYILFLHCFSILPYVIMLDNDIIVLPLVIKPSLLTYYLSQGSVSVILTLVYPCCGIWHIEGQNVFAYPTFYICMLLTYLVSCPG